jgi:hypothetical protein
MIYGSGFGNAQGQSYTLTVHRGNGKTSSGGFTVAACG